jgi:hypothetical protein
MLTYVILVLSAMPSLTVIYSLQLIPRVIAVLCKYQTECKREFKLIMFAVAHHSGRAVWGTKCFRSLESWDRRFKSHSRHACLYCVPLLCVCVALCAGSGLAMGLSPIKGVQQIVYMIKKLKKRPRHNEGLHNHNNKTNNNNNNNNNNACCFTKRLMSDSKVRD